MESVIYWLLCTVNEKCIKFNVQGRSVLNKMNYYYCYYLSLPKKGLCGECCLNIVSHKISFTEFSIVSKRLLQPKQSPINTLQNFLEL